MAAGVQPIGAAQHHICEEDSPISKGMAYVPFVGIIHSFFQERSLASKIGKTKSSLPAAYLIDVKNQYKIANVVNSVVSLALLVAGLATGILSSIVFAFGLGFLVTYGAKNFEGYHENKVSIQKLKLNPDYFKMTIY